MNLLRKGAVLLAALILFAATPQNVSAEEQTEPKSYIKWIDFDVPAPLLKNLIQLDIEAREDASICRFNWIEALSCLAAKCGGDFSRYKTSQLKWLTDALREGKTMNELSKGLKTYDYYFEAYSAVLGGMLGEYDLNTGGSDAPRWEHKYGLRAFSPIAKGFDYNHYDDFGNGRNYGYKRKHMGHDLMALTGTPVISVESGVVEELGWNQYGGWRVGIRSFDGLRYWYYAHLRQNRPYARGLEKGGVVMAGDVIGYVGRTGYSARENTNGLKQSHLHVGLQIIFDPAQKDGDNQIWIDLYEITKLLSGHKSQTVRDPDTKEHTRASAYREHIPEERFAPAIGPEEELETDVKDQPEPYADVGRVSVPVPVIMYHSILKNPSHQNRYTITPWALECDLRWLCENGYQSISVDELVAFVETGASLPEKPVMLTFDDGYYNNIHYAGPMLEKYGHKAAIFVVGEFCDRAADEKAQNPNFSYVDWDTMSSLPEGIWSVENHTYGLHKECPRKGVKKRRDESREEYVAMLEDDLGRLTVKISEATGRTPLAFSYPFGELSDEVEHVLDAMGYKATFTSTDGISVITSGEPESLHRMKRRVRSSDIGIGELVRK